MKRTQLALAISGLFVIAPSALAQAVSPQIPESFIPQETTPSIDSVIEGKTDGWSEIEQKWTSGSNASAKNNKYLNGQELNRYKTDTQNQILYLDTESALINSTIDSIQVILGDSFADVDNSIAIGTVIKGGTDGKNGILQLNSGAKAFDTVIENMGSMSLRYDTKAYNTLVKAGGLQTLGDRSYAQATIIDGGEQVISVTAHTAVAEDTVVINGGQQIVYSGTAKNSHIGAGGYQLASGLAIDTQIYDSGYQVVYSGQGADTVAAQGTIVYNGGTQRVQSGIADGSVIYGEQIITNLDGDWQNGAWVANEDPEATWGTSPTATNSKIMAGGTQTVDKYGHAYDTIVDGGTQLVKAYGHIQDTTIENSGNTTIEFGGYSLGDLTVNDGSLTMEAGDLHYWTENLGKGAYAQTVTLNGESANLYIKHNQEASESTVTIDNLALANGHVNFGSADGSDQGKYSRLELENLTGSGTIAMNVDVQNQQGDFLSVNNTIADSDQFMVAVKDSGTEVSDQELHIITAGSGSADSAFTLLENSRFADAGAYMVQYDLEHRTNDENAQEEWYLTTHSTDTTTPSTDAALALANVTPTIWDAELSTLRQRLGELDNSNLQNGVWGKFITSRYNVEHDVGAAYKQNMNGFVLGGDHALERANGTLHLGMMAGYSGSNISFKRGGNGDVNSYTLGGYATYIANSGFYSDVVLKYNYFRNKMNARSTQGDVVSGKYNLSGFGFSTEVGKKYQFDNIFVAPYGMLSTFISNSADYTLSNGMKVEADNASSFKTEVGSVFGYDIEFSNGYIKPYFKLAANYEFVDNNKLYINDSDKFNNDLSGAAIKVGVGATVQLNNNFSAYTEINYMKGNDIDMPYSGNIGLRYSF